MSHQTETTSHDGWPSLEEVEEILNYKFSNKELLEAAFTHASYGDNVVSYERLEYRPQSSHYQKTIFHLPRSTTRRPHPTPSSECGHRKTRTRRHKKPLLEDQVRDFSKSILDYPLHSNGLVDAQKALADIVESCIGAVFIDCGCSVDIVWSIFENLLEPVISLETLERHPVTDLYEICHKKNLSLKFVDLWKETSAVQVWINDEMIGSAKYGGKKEIAYNRAAKDALEHLLRSRFLEEKDDIN